MKLLEKILLAIDFIDTDNTNLVNTAAKIAKTFNSELVVMNVITGKFEDPSVEKYLKKFADGEMKKVSKVLEKEQVNFTTRIAVGNPFETLLEYSEKEDFNVILTGPGNTGLISDKPGVIAKKLTRKSMVPVWIVKNAPEKGYSKILCPVDFSDSSRRALSNAILLSSKLHGHLKIISVYEPIEIVSGRISDDLNERNFSAKKSYEEKFMKFLEDFDLKNVSYETEILQGKPVREILAQAKSKKFDLLIMGTTGRSGLNRILIGSVTESVLEDTPISFITTKKKDILNPEFELKISRMENLMSEAEKKMLEGDYKKASELFEKCLEIENFFIPAIDGLARSYRDSGKKDLSRKYENYAEEIKNRLWRSAIGAG